MTDWYFAGYEKTGIALPLSLSSYTGPGDIVAGASAWWGLRAYSAAQCTGSVAAIRIVKTSDGSAAQDINILTTGSLDVATIAGLGYGVSVTKIYDQSGNGLDLTQATLANMPVLMLNALGSLPLMQFTTQFLQTAALGATINQPFTVSAMAKRTSNVGSSISFFGPSDVAVLVGGADTTDVWRLFAGLFTSSNNTATENAHHALQGVFNGGSSDCYVDGNTSAGDPGPNTLNSGTTLLFGAGGDTSKWVGFMGELGVWPIAFSSGNKSSMNSNQHAYWGF